MAWQAPYVNIFRKYGAGEWQKCSKEGDVTKLMDRAIKSSVIRLVGSIPAGNYIEFPHKKSAPLGLVGHMFYLLFKPIEDRYFLIHLDICAADNVTVRVSLSNMYKEFKSTLTWLQFPVIANPRQGSVDEAIRSEMDVKAQLGIAPTASRWTVMCLDLQYILSVYLNKHYLYLKTIKLCSSMIVKNVFTSSNNYQPGLDVKFARKTGLIAEGIIPLPREMNFPLENGEEWHRKYDFIRFPADKKEKTLHKDMIPGRALTPTARLGILSPESKVRRKTKKKTVKETDRRTSPISRRKTSPERVRRKGSPRSKSAPQLNKKETYRKSNPVTSRIALAERVAYSMLGAKLEDNDLSSMSLHSNKSILRSSHYDCVEQQQSKHLTKSLPEVNFVESADGLNSAKDIHVYASPSVSKYKGKENVSRSSSRRINVKNSKHKHTLSPDPILSLKKVVGFSGINCKQVVYCEGGNILYACHGLIVSHDPNTGQQSFLLGHTDKVSALAYCATNGVLASAQCGLDSAIRIWKLNSHKCIALFNSHICDVNIMCFSSSGSKLCTVGESTHGKQVILVWDTSQLLHGGNVTIIAKAHTELRANNVNCLKFVPFDHERLISCGNHNIRIWRVKENSLRSRPFDLFQYATVDFTSFDFLLESRLAEENTDFSIFFATDHGSVYEVSLKSLKVVNIHQILPKQKQDKKQRQLSEGIRLNSICAGTNFFAIGSNDGMLRLYTTNFKAVLLEAEHDDAVCITGISLDNTSVVAGTSNGNLGTLDITRKSYTTLTRSHTGPITSFSFEHINNHIATVSEDNSIKIWNVDSVNQIYDFQATDEKPTSICCHPTQAVFACGFRNGAVRIFSLITTSLIFELKEHLNIVHCLLYSPSGEYLYSIGRDGSLVMYKSFTNSYEVLRRLTNVVCRDGTLANQSMSIDENGHRLAVIGGSEFLITVFSANTLDELLRIDITSMTCHRSRFLIDEALAVCFTPPNIGHLLVVTRKSRLLKFECNSGQLITEFSGLHVNDVTSICCSRDGKYIATAGDHCIKIWKYDMGKEFQVFIGHCSPIWQLEFTPDNTKLVSVGETLFVWDFFGTQTKPCTEILQQNSMMNQSISQKTLQESTKKLSTLTVTVPHVEENKATDHLNVNHLTSSKPRAIQPRPVEQSKDLDYTVIHVDDNDNDEDEEREVEKQSNNHSFTREDENDIDFIVEKTFAETSLRQPPVEHSVNITEATSHHAPPNVIAHFKAREKISELAKKRYAAPTHQAGMKLYGAIGCHGNGRNNVVWHPETGLFAYSSGCSLVFEDLNSGEQRILQQHTEDISTLALQNDGQVIATGGSLSKSNNYGMICIWFVQSSTCHKILEEHNASIISLQYSRDDRYMVSIGDYRECSFVVWCATNYVVLVQKWADYPIHAVQWNPYTSHQLVSVGRKGTVLFWTINEKQNSERLELKVSEGLVPQEVFPTNGKGVEDMTAVCFASRDYILTATAHGIVCVWKYQEQTCCMHWKADQDEIDILISRNGKLITGSASKNLSLWNIPASLHNSTGVSAGESSELLLQKEKKLDGCVVSAVFDDDLDMGIVSTTNGTIWYINWADQDDVRIVSGHHEKVSSVTLCGGSSRYFATSTLDGSVRLWNLETREQTAQFLVLGHGCCCVAFCCLPTDRTTTTISTTTNETYQQTIYPTSNTHEHPSQAVCGYSDGTVRTFDFAKMELLLKMKPHSNAVVAVTCSVDGRVIISGCESGLIAVSSNVTGMTIRVLNDHKGSPICTIQKQQAQNSQYWLASSQDRRISLWRSDWSKDICELHDWITFPGHVFNNTKTPATDVIPPTLAFFHVLDRDIIIYTGYSIQCEVALYSISKKQVTKTISLTDWALSLDISKCGNLLAAGFKDRIVKLVDIYSGTFQDFVGHSDSIEQVKFTTDGKYLFTAAHTELFLWKVLL